MRGWTYVAEALSTMVLFVVTTSFILCCVKGLPVDPDFTAIGVSASAWLKAESVRADRDRQGGR